MKKVAIIGTGGTISALGEDRLDFKDYRSGSLTLAEILDKIPEIGRYAEIEMTQLENFSSTDLTPHHWIRLKKLVEWYLFEKEVDGVVITHGTSTLEESAYFLHLTMDTRKPIVFTGAQRPFSALGSDAAINFVHAVRVAVEPESENKGVLVVLNGEISCAREVTKADTFRLQTFQSGPFGFLGSVDVDGTVQYYRQPTRKHTTASPFSQLPIKELPEVAILYSYAGVKPDLIHFILEQKNYDGIVVAGMGAGRLSKLEKEALIQAVQEGIPVVRCSRVAEGRVVEYADDRETPFIYGDNLLPQKARILLMLSLLKTSQAAEIQKLFDQH